MNYTFEKADKSTVKIDINCDKSEWNAAIDKAYQQNKSKYSIQGFRKGKVPKKILESVYGEGIFYEDAINNIFTEKYYEILDKEPTIEAIDRPDLSVDKISADGITLTAKVAVKPEVELGAYTGIKFEKVEYNVKDEDIEAELKRIIERNSRFEEVERPAKDGDTVIIDYAGSIDGKLFDGGSAKEYSLVLGSDSFIPGFETQIVGMNIGEEKDITVKFPTEYHAAELAGKDAVFAVKLHKVREKQAPELTDDFIKDATGEETLEAYRQKTKDKLTAEAKERAERELENNIIKTISESSKAEIPDVLVQRQIESMVKDTEYRLMYQGLKLNDYLKYMGTTLDELKKSYEKQAADIVMQQLIVEGIIAKENIAADENEIEAKIEEDAKSVGKEKEEYKKNMHERQFEYIKNEIIVKKLFDFLRANNTIG